MISEGCLPSCTQHSLTHPPLMLSSECQCDFFLRGAEGGGGGGCCGRLRTPSSSSSIDSGWVSLRVHGPRCIAAVDASLSSASAASLRMSIVSFFFFPLNRQLPEKQTPHFPPPRVHPLPSEGETRDNGSLMITRGGGVFEGGSPLAGGLHGTPGNTAPKRSQCAAYLSAVLSG